ncbi:unnamed protein product [Rotaria sp. Silwood2]|nr:unnamed protein product [Rotaria sp. Silwood2]
MQLSYCNLCSGRKELPCLSNCVNVIESCLINVSLINDIWINFIDSIENNIYFNGIEKALSSIGILISDAFTTLFNSDQIQTKEIIDQCGYIHIRKEIFDNDQKFHKEYSNSLSILDQQLKSMKQSLQTYRSFWLMLPEQICKSNGHSISTKETCWTGTSISLNNKQPIRTTYDKPLSLRLQRILKEMKEKSHMIRNIQQITTGINTSTTTTTTVAKNSLLINGLTLNLTDGFDDYPDDNEFDYADYAYEDSIDEITSSIQTTSSTTLKSSKISVYDDLLIDDINTVSYYDYGEQDAYSDDEIDDTYTQKLSSISTISTTTIVQIPSYHQRRPITWNINIDDDFDQKSQQQYNSSFSHNYSFLLLLLLIFILT